LVLDRVPTVCFILLDLDRVWNKLSLIYKIPCTYNYMVHISYRKLSTGTHMPDSWQLEFQLIAKSMIRKVTNICEQM
jgi:hypothetical protein